MVCRCWLGECQCKSFDAAQWNLEVGVGALACSSARIESGAATRQIECSARAHSTATTAHASTLQFSGDGLGTEAQLELGAAHPITAPVSTLVGCLAAPQALAPPPAAIILTTRAH